jgi:hypothetical protein
MTKAEHLKHITRSIESYTKRRVECWVCCEVESTTSHETQKAFANYLYKKGWRYIESEKFATIGLACKECSETPDDKRGD